MAGGEAAWSVVVPVKQLALAKTRLMLPAAARARLALAMAADTVRAALRASGVGEVIVVTADADARLELESLGAVVVDDEPDAGLNPALRHGAANARYPAVAALSSDLPALTSDDLAAVLAVAATAELAAVADLEGSGTTAFTARGRRRFTPAFGPGSFDQHLAAGGRDITAAAGRSLRQDVDTLEALRAALTLGVGAATTAAVKDLGHLIG